MMQRLSDAVTMLLVSGLSLLLVVYVGFGEAQRTYSRFHVDKLHSQGQILQMAMAGYLRAGLPLGQYVGFATRAEAILASDQTISSISVYDASGRLVFTSGEDEVPSLGAGTPMAGVERDDRIDLRQAGDFMRVVLPLSNKFERVGSLAITTPRASVTEHLEDRFENLLLVAGLLSLGFAWFAAVVGPRVGGRRLPWLQIGFAVTFLTMSGIIVGNLLTLYSEGAQEETKSLANSLGQRLRDVVDFNIKIDDLDGLDEAFNEYRRLNPNISAAGLIVNERVAIHTDAAAVGKPWMPDRTSYEYVIDLTRPEVSANKVHVAVALPTEIVLRQALRSVKNFGALFVASAFLAGLFLHLAHSLQSVQRSQSARSRGDRHSELIDSELSLIKPIFFVAVLAEHLTYSFLPQFVARLLSDVGASPGLVSAPFMAYYLCFALTLIPAGHCAQLIGPRRLIYLGLSLAAASLVSLSFVGDFSSLMLARAAAGIGQGALFIGVQCYILAKAPSGKKTQGAAIIVFGFQGGMISGMAIGSRLVDRIGKTESILFWGTVISGVGLLLMGVSGWDVIGDHSGGQVLKNASVIIGVTVVGLAHGFINAPVVTRIADSRLAGKIGANSATASYRFLERIGHIAGPIVVGQLFLVLGQDVEVLNWIGAAVVAFGILFILSCAPVDPTRSTQEYAHD